MGNDKTLIKVYISGGLESKHLQTLKFKAHFDAIMFANPGCDFVILDLDDFHPKPSPIEFKSFDPGFLMPTHYETYLDELAKSAHKVAGEWADHDPPVDYCHNNEPRSKKWRCKPDKRVINRRKRKARK